MDLLTWLEAEPNWREFVKSREIKSLDQLKLASPKYYFSINFFAFEINQKTSLEQIESQLNISRKDSLYFLRCLFGSEFEAFHPITKKEKIDLTYDHSFNVIGLPRYYLKLKQTIFYPLIKTISWNSIQLSKTTPREYLFPSLSVLKLTA